MLRFLLLLFVRLVMVISGFSLLVFHAWGWSEYASPDLYVIYYQITAKGVQYFIANADGSGDGQKLTSSDGKITQMDCSPDGRTLAWLTGSHHLYEVTSAGAVRTSSEDPRYATINVADDGTTALFDPPEGKLLVNDRSVPLSAPDHSPDEFDRIDISSRGQVLWMRDFKDIQIMSLASGLVTPIVSHGYSAQWLANEQIFTYAEHVTDVDEDIDLYGGQYLVDAATGNVIKVGDWDLSRPLSPDGTKIAGALAVNSGTHLAQVVVYDLFTDGHRHVVTHDAKTASQPLCFLTFRPTSLIGASSR